jgi:hypothetical protein
MDCCGHAYVLTPQPLPMASITAMLGGEVGGPGSTELARTAETTAAALDVLRKSISVDVHSHGGSTGIASKAPPSGDLAKAIRTGALAIAGWRSTAPRCGKSGTSG